MKKMFLMTALLVLVGCNTMPTVPGDKQTVNFDKSLLQDCPELPKTKSASDNDLNDWAAAVLQMYTECAINKQKENVEIKKALNIK